MLTSIALSTFITLGGWSVHSESGYHDCNKQEKSYTQDMQTNIVYENKQCTKSKYNYNHNAIIVEHDGYTIGTYKNSYFQRTNLIGYTYRHKNLSVTGAIGTGYTRLKNNDYACTLPAFGECVLITVSYSLEPLKVTLMGSALAVAFEFKL